MNNRWHMLFAGVIVGILLMAGCGSIDSSTQARPAAIEVEDTIAVNMIARPGVRCIYVSPAGVGSSNKTGSLSCQWKELEK